MWRARNKTPRSRGDAGFSVVEALVALSVFALAGVGLVQLQSHSLRTLSHVERVALGGIVAQNLLVDAAASVRAPELGERQGETEMGGRVWQWRMRVEPTTGANVRRVTVIVLDNGRQAAAGEAFVGAGS